MPRKAWSYPDGPSDYNHVRPHRSLGQRTPIEALIQARTTPELSLEIL